VTLALMLCSCHASPGRLAAQKLEDDCADPRTLELAAALAGKDMMVVVVRDAAGDLHWQLLPRRA
jgi:hypothetical protein